MLDDLRAQLSALGFTPAPSLKDVWQRGDSTAMDMAIDSIDGAQNIPLGIIASNLSHD